MNHFGAALNAVCPYYTMFPLEFPLVVLTRHSRPKQRILDPFCGKGGCAAYNPTTLRQLCRLRSQKERLMARTTQLAARQGFEP